MSRHLKRLLAVSMEDAMVEPVIGEAPDVLVLEDQDTDNNFPELDAIGQIYEVDGAVDNFMTAVNADTSPSAAALEAYVVALESIFAAGGMSGVFSKESVSVESVAALRVSLEEVHKRTEIALEGLIDKFFTRISEMFGKFDIELNELLARCERIKHELIGNKSTPTHAAIKVTDGNRLFTNDVHTFSSMMEGFKNTEKVSKAINTNLLGGVETFAAAATKKIVDAYNEGDAAADTGMMIALVYCFGIIAPFFHNGSFTNDSNFAKTNTEANKLVEHFRKVLKPVSNFAGSGILLPGGRVIEVASSEPFYNTIPELKKPSHLKRESTVSIPVPKPNELLSLMVVLKQAAEATKAAQILLKASSTKIEAIVEHHVGNAKSDSNHGSFVNWAAGKRARYALNRYFSYFFKSFLEILRYNELTISHGLAFVEKAAKLYH